MLSRGRQRHCPQLCPVRPRPSVLITAPERNPPVSSFRELPAELARADAAQHVDAGFIDGDRAKGVPPGWGPAETLSLLLARPSMAAFTSLRRCLLAEGGRGRRAGPPCPGARAVEQRPALPRGSRGSRSCTYRDRETRVDCLGGVSDFDDGLLYLHCGATSFLALFKLGSEEYFVLAGRAPRRRWMGDVPAGRSPVVLHTASCSVLANHQCTALRYRTCPPARVR